MAETTITKQTIVYTGITPTLAAANADGSKFINTGKTFIHAKNTNGAIRTITVQAQVGSPPLGTDQDIAVVIPITTGEKIFGPFPKKYYDDSTGYAHMTYDAVADLTVAVYELP